MSPPAFEGAKCPASSATLNAQQETTSSVGREPVSSASSEFLVDQQQNSGLSSSVEDQLRRQITGLEDRIRQFKVNQDPSCQFVKHSLLQEELARLREKNLDLRVDLQVAHEKHQALKSEHHKYKRQMKKVLGEAIKNLSRGLDISKEGSGNAGLTTEGDAPQSSLPTPQTVSCPITEKASVTPSASQCSVTGSTGESSLVQTNTFGQLAALGTSAGFPDSLKINKPYPSLFGDPKEMIQPLGEDTVVLVNMPGFCHGQEQSFEEARLRRYELYNDKTVLSGTLKWLETFGSSKAFAPKILFCDALSSGGFFQTRKEGGRREGQPPGSIDNAGANSGGSFKPAEPKGDGTANMTPANDNAGKD